ncbi:Cytochrome oxidase assembly protein shy1 [Tolypocladium capitatum]|uniref:SURF1-like protein n=1 Tax=Tolypocladium capitatum TaxID=45235 RepID=A0A2K3QA97_9HYPO|nr:Cytochrome oxidase assembly protein shy1 [Tolypocladium capitatum]
MNCTLRLLRGPRAAKSLPRTAPRCARIARPAPPRRPFSTSRPRSDKPQPVDDPDFVSILDAPPQIVRAGRRHGPGLILLGSFPDRRGLLKRSSQLTLAARAALIPITAFALGTWQVQRLGWKTELIAKFEDRLVREPLPLPPHVDPSVIHDFDFRRVLATGRFRHDQEMLIGPRMRDGKDGYMVVTPLEREGGSTVLVNRGWISKKHRRQRTRPASLPRGLVTVEGLLREPWKKNMFTPENRPDQGEFYFPDVEQMAALTNTEPEFMRMMDHEARGIPFGRAAEVNLRNNHAQYIFTWYALFAPLVRSLLRRQAPG